MQFPELPIDGTPNVPISFYFEDVTFELPDQQGLIDWLLEVAGREEKTWLEVSFIFCSDEHLHSINLEYLQHDYYTDVITFPLSDQGIHGDIFISSERVADNARTEGVSFLHELCRVLVHGVLHLAGYGDKTPEQITIMRKKENEYLGRLSLLS